MRESTAESFDPPSLKKFAECIAALRRIQSVFPEQLLNILRERAIGLFARYAARRRSCGFDSVCPQERFEFGFRDLFVRILDVAKRSVKLTWPQLFRFEFSGVLCLRNSPMKFRFAWAKHIDSQNRIKIRGGGRLDHKGRGRAERISLAAFC